jgi:hypothetical protein
MLSKRILEIFFISLVLNFAIIFPFKTMLWLSPPKIAMVLL